MTEMSGNETGRLAGTKRGGNDLLANEIARIIKQKIQYEEYKGGDRLVVRKLCEDFGASETPVKQALNQLMSVGLVSATPNCGMRVSTFGVEEFKQVLIARKMIEMFCARDAVLKVRRDHAFAEQIKELLERSNRQYERCIEDFTKENFSEIPENDRMLHAQIVCAGENAEIIRMYNGLNSHAGMFTGYSRHSPQTLRNVISQHNEIVEALLICDVDGLRAAIEKHIQSTIEVFEKKAG